MNQQVIKIVGLVTGERTVYDGQYVIAYDVEKRDLQTTPDIDKATRFDAGDAFELWRKVDPREPLREDGKPNRPLTIFTVEMQPAPKEGTR